MNASFEEFFSFCVNFLLERKKKRYDLGDNLKIAQQRRGYVFNAMLIKAPNKSIWEVVLWRKDIIFFRNTETKDILERKHLPEGCIEAIDHIDQDWCWEQCIPGQIDEFDLLITNLANIEADIYLLNEILEKRYLVEQWFKFRQKCSDRSEQSEDRLVDFESFIECLQFNKKMSKHVSEIVKEKITETID